MPTTQPPPHKSRLLVQPTAIGRIAIAERNGNIVQLLFEGERVPFVYEEGESALLLEAFQQLHEYLLGKRTNFTLSLAPMGTPFMQAVWKALTTIPYGTTLSYGALAVQLGSRRHGKSPQSTSYFSSLSPCCWQQWRTCGLSWRDGS
jgi:methylated-DNA-[protein]-cysteine S-methyltransferase